jgi:hypothetical protein
MMGSVTVFITSAPYVAIEVLGVSPSAYGLLFFLPAFASFCGFFFTARMVHRLGGLRMMRMGAGLSFLGAALLLGLTLAGAAHPLALFLPGMLVCAANALSAPNSTTGAITAAPAIAGAASGLLGFFQLVVGADGNPAGRVSRGRHRPAARRRDHHPESRRARAAGEADIRGRHRHRHRGRTLEQRVEPLDTQLTPPGPGTARGTSRREGAMCGGRP